MKSDRGKLLILVEGVGDKRFLEDVCAKHLEDECQILLISGKPNWKNALHLNKNQLQENSDKGGRNFLILDADEDSVQDLTDQIAKEAIKLSIFIESFLFPDNHSTGDLESLIYLIVPEENQAFIECWQEYLTCITAKLPDFEIPNRKKTIAAYQNWFHTDKSKMSPGKRDYTETLIWNLKHPELDPLITFLKGE